MLTLVPHNHWWYTQRDCAHCWKLFWVLPVVCMSLLLKRSRIVKILMDGYQDFLEIFFNQGRIRDVDDSNSRDRLWMIKEWFEMNKDESDYPRTEFFCGKISDRFLIGMKISTIVRGDSQEDLSPIICAFYFWSFVISNTVNCCKHPV